jgi:hypothetical protein
VKIREIRAWFKNTDFVVTVSTDLAAIGYDGFT